jgi:hypothetical protein
MNETVAAANGDNDIMTSNTRLLAQKLPTAQVSIYLGAGHGFLFQYPNGARR